MAMNLRQLIDLLNKANKVEQIDCYRREIAELIPVVSIMFEFDQQSCYHQYDLWQHSLHTVVNLPKDAGDDILFLAALLHDIGKPDSQVSGKNADDFNKHYYGHPTKSAEIVQRDIIPGLLDKGEKISLDEQRKLIMYVLWHDDMVSLRMRHLRKYLNMGISFDEFQKIMLLQIADAKAHILLPPIQDRIDMCEKLAGEYGAELYKRILEEKKE